MTYGVKGPTTLSLLPEFDCVQGFPIDYMHTILLGVTRSQAKLWFDSSFSSSECYIGRKTKLVDERLLKFQPPDFTILTPRSISERKLCKASEWRNWLLFYSLLSLSGILKKYFGHWKYLVAGT